MIRIPFIVLLCLFYEPIFSQFHHLDFIGAGHDQEVRVRSSHQEHQAPQTTVDGFPVQNPKQLAEASRFLAQTTFGADLATIQMTAAMGYEAWLEEQFQLPSSTTLAETKLHGSLYGDEEDMEEENLWAGFFKSAWLTNTLSGSDQLRQRMAYALSQIMVVNDAGDLFADYAQFQAAYYDILTEQAFNNYLQLLTEVSLSPTMGNFLSHYANPKAIPELNIHPDENYAREIMQLFSIGLWELNPDGTRKYDSEGNFIPTYDNADIKAFARVFTGLGDGLGGSFGPIWESESFEQTIVTPMNMFEQWHDQREKKLLNGFVIPAGQSGMEDIRQTMHHLSTHPNTAPFIAKALIQRFTTSNPSPAYVASVAAAFKATEHGNFKEVLKAIFLHPEARQCPTLDVYTFGKLREPILRLTNFLKAFQLSPNEYDDFHNQFYCYRMSVGQAPLGAPSVFNFYLPDYAPQGPIKQRYLVAPEFQILNAPNAIGYINDLEYRVNRQLYLEELCLDIIAENYEEEIDEIPYSVSYEEDWQMDFSDLYTRVSNPADLVDYLNLVLANGLLTEPTQAIIEQALNGLSNPVERIKMGIYLTLISPDYVIQK